MSLFSDTPRSGATTPSVWGDTWGFLVKINKTTTLPRVVVIIMAAIIAVLFIGYGEYVGYFMKDRSYYGTAVPVAQQAAVLIEKVTRYTLRGVLEGDLRVALLAEFTARLIPMAAVIMVASYFKWRTSVKWTTIVVVSLLAQMFFLVDQPEYSPLGYTIVYTLTFLAAGGLRQNFALAFSASSLVHLVGIMNESLGLQLLIVESLRRGEIIVSLAKLAAGQG